MVPWAVEVSGKLGECMEEKRLVNLLFASISAGANRSCYGASYTSIKHGGTKSHGEVKVFYSFRSGV